MSKQVKSVQTKLIPSAKNDDAWKTIGRAKQKREQTLSPRLDRNDNKKKPDTKNTPPRPADTIDNPKQNTSPNVEDRKPSAKQNPITTPLPESPTNSNNDLEAEDKLLAAIEKSLNTNTPFLDQADFPPLKPQLWNP
jgi:hypothetical protein